MAYCHTACFHVLLTYTVMLTIKNMHHYHQQLKTKTSHNLHKNFSRHNLVNSDVIYVKIIQLVDKYSLVLMT